MPGAGDSTPQPGSTTAPASDAAPDNSEPRRSASSAATAGPNSCLATPNANDPSKLPAAGPQQRDRLPASSILDRPQQSRLANPRIPLDQQHAGDVADGSPDDVRDRRQLGIALHKRSFMTDENSHDAAPADSVANPTRAATTQNHEGHPDAAAARPRNNAPITPTPTIQLLMRFDATAEPITGTVQHGPEGDCVNFRGWLALTQAIETIRRAASRVRDPQALAQQPARDGTGRTSTPSVEVDGDAGCRDASTWTATARTPATTRPWNRAAARWKPRRASARPPRQRSDASDHPARDVI